MSTDLYYQKHIFVCTNQKEEGRACCANKGGSPFFAYLKEALIKHNLHGPGKIRVSQSGCLGRCTDGPWLVIYPEGTWHRYETTDDLDRMIEVFSRTVRPEACA